MSTSRIIWIDYCKAIAITLVIMLHIAIPNPYRTIIYSFIIPIFFLLSGMFACPDKYPTSKVFFQQKTLRLLVPYLFFNAVTYIYWCFIARHQGADAESVISLWKPILGALLGIEAWMEHCKPLWFLPCLMMAEWIFYLLVRLSKGHTFLLLFTVLITTTIGFVFSKLNLSLPYTIGGALSMILFYYAGYWARSNHFFQLLHNYSHRRSLLIWLSISIIALGICAWLSVQTSESNVFNNTYGNLFYALPAAVCGSLGIVTLGISLYNILPTSRCLIYIGRHTMTILALHLMVAGWIKGVTYYLFHLSLNIYDSLWVKVLFAITIITVCLPLCYAYDWVVKKWKLHKIVSTSTK